MKHNIDYDLLRDQILTLNVLMIRSQDPETKEHLLGVMELLDTILIEHIESVGNTCE